MAALILMQQSLKTDPGSGQSPLWDHLSLACVWLLPIVVTFTGLIMVSTIRYPHLINRYLRGRHPWVGSCVFW